MVSVRRTGRPPPFAAERLITSAATASWAAASIIVTVSYKSDKQVSESRVADGRTDGRTERRYENDRLLVRHTATTAAACGGGGGLGRPRADEGKEEQGGAGNRFRPAHAISLYPSRNPLLNPNDHLLGIT